MEKETVETKQESVDIKLNVFLKPRHDFFILMKKQPRAAI